MTAGSRPRLVFTTYYRLAPTGQIGIFKRCTRLMSRLADDFDIHLVNFGPLPWVDPLFASVAPRITIHETPDYDRGLGDMLHELYASLRPDAVILGETPIRGSMRMSHRVASHLGLWQVGIDNYYGSVFPASITREWPKIDRWLLLGLTRNGNPSAREGPTLVVPPLIRFPPGFQDGLERDRVAILGYDKQTLFTGTHLIGRLPADQKIDIFIAPQWEAFLRRQPVDLERPGIRVLVLPSDEELYGSLARSFFILGKAGFQQVVEGILLGAPIVCQAAGGGLADVIVADFLKPYVRFVRSEQELPKVLWDVAFWLAGPPVRKWANMATEVPDPIAYAAENLTALIDEGLEERGRRMARPA
jgi:hypothetical protein